MGFWREYVSWLHLFVLFHLDTCSGGIYEGQIWETVGSCHGEGTVDVLARDLVKGRHQNRLCSAIKHEVAVDCHTVTCLSGVCLSYFVDQSNPYAYQEVSVYMIPHSFSFISTMNPHWYSHSFQLYSSPSSSRYKLPQPPQPILLFLATHSSPPSLRFALDSDPTSP